MSERIKFEDLYGNPTGYVDLKDDKLVASNERYKHVVDNWLDIRMRTPQEFVDYYGNPDNSGSFSYHILVDSDTDETEYPES